ncbi:MAG: hypothetical protein AB7O45_00485 [Alphaproteobacteria bacterium]
MSESVAPAHVAIVALGASSLEYVKAAEGYGGRHCFDEVWTVNSFGGVLQADRVFHMDDVRVQEARAAADPTGKIARMLEWMRTAPGPIYTSRPHPDYPGLVAYPLEAVINAAGADYFNGTPPYALALAIAIGVRRLSLYGFDYSYPNQHDAEQGRGCAEYWIGRAEARGIEVEVAASSTLLDAYLKGAPGRPRYYGYDTVDVRVARRSDGGVTVEQTPHDRIPTAAEIEARYDHSRRPEPAR